MYQLHKMEKESPIANFKTAISSTVKTISEDDNVEITFGNQNSSSGKKIIKLPNLEENTKIDYTSVRGFADSEALKIKYSNSMVYESNKPKGNISKKLYQIAEKIRYEKIGSDKYIGIKNNIQNTYSKKLNGLDLKKSENKTVNAFENYLRSNIFSYRNSKDVEKNFKSLQKKFDIQFKSKINTLKNTLNNQFEFNSLVSNLLSEMDIEESFDNEEIKDKNENKDKQNKPEENQQNDQKSKDEDNSEISIDAGLPDLENQTKDSDIEGEEIEIKSRKVIIHNFKVTEIKIPKIKFKIECSKGTYIRSIAHDFGVKLNNGAFLSDLIRTKIGNFDINDAKKIDDFKKELNSTKSLT